MIRNLFGAFCIFTCILLSNSLFGGGAFSAVLVKIQDESGKPLPGARVDLKAASSPAISVTADANGTAKFDRVAPGAYQVAVVMDGFDGLSQQISVEDGQQIELSFKLIPKLQESVDVHGESKNPVQASTAPAELQRSQIKNMAQRPATVSDALPLLPGVVRIPDGELKISGSGEHRSALLVDGVDVTDPATGQFGLTVPVDSVETLSVFKSPFLAEYGRFSAGVVSVETRRGGDKWNFELNDPLPEFRIRNLRLRGLRDVSPRVTFSGPLISQRFYFSEALEYELEKRPIETLPFPENETNSQTLNSFTQFDYLFSKTNTLTATIHNSWQDREFVNLNFFNPRPVTPNYNGNDWAATVLDKLLIGNSLLENAISIQRFNRGISSQGNGEMILSPTGNTGNYFSSQDAQASRIEWRGAYSLAPIESLGAHNLKFGATATRVSNEGEFFGRRVKILDQNGNLIRQIDFAGGSPYRRSDLELEFFGQDHWLLKPNIVMDLGMRFERQGITSGFRVAPRIGLAWTPFGDRRTVLRGGWGIFYDRVPLSVFSFDRYPEEVITDYDGRGNQIGPPIRLQNIIEFNQGVHAGDFAPYSAAWNAEVEHSIGIFRVRASFLQTNSYNTVIVSPENRDGASYLVLKGNGREQYRQLELTTRVSWNENRQFFLSYVRSLARGDLNDFNHFLGNFPFPVLRPNEFSALPSDLPNRFLFWGISTLPWRMRVAPMLEYRNGFPYSQFDVTQNYFGTANATRFPDFFSFDARVSKDIPLNEKYTLRLSVSGFNLTNHFNPLEVHSITVDPNYGIFFGNLKRRFRLDLDVLF